MTPRSYNSKSVRLADRFAGEIGQGAYPLGRLLPTEATLSKRYGVSRLTLRRALDMLIGQGLLIRLPHRGVQVMGKPKTVSSPAETTSAEVLKEFSIAAVLAAPPDEGLAAIQEGIEACSRDLGLSLQLVSTDHAQESERVFETLSHIEDLGVDGAIILPYPGDPHTDLLNSLWQRRFPIVCIERRSAEIQVPSVEPDNKTGMYRATQHLISRHKRPVCYLGMQLDHKTDLDRYDGYVRAMKDADYGAHIESSTFLHSMHSADPAYWRLERPWQIGYEVAIRIFAAGRPPYFIVCLKDYLAWGVYKAAAERGYAVGDDVYVVGFDDLEIAQSLTPPLTTVHQDLTEKGYQAARLLRQIIRSEFKAPIQVTLPVELVVRGSS